MNSDISPTTQDKSYFQWRKSAVQNNLLLDVYQQFYQDDIDTYGYHFTLNEAETKLPVLTTKSWVRPDIKSVSIQECEHPLPTNEEREWLTQFTRPMAFDSQKELQNFEVSDFIWNGTICGTDSLNLGDSTVSISPLSFYTAATNISKLRESDYKSLYSHNVSPTETQPFPTSAIADTPRGTQFPQLQSLADSPTPLSTGVGASTIVNTGDEYALLLSERGKHTAGRTGWFELCPAGFIEPSTTDTLDVLTETILREVGEEVFGHPESGTPIETEEVQALKKSLQSGDATLTKTFAQINPEQHHFSLFTTLIINDEAFYDTYLSPDSLGGWENESIRLVSLSDTDSLTEILQTDYTSWTHLPAIVETLRYLNAECDHITTSVKPTRLNP